MIMIMPIITVRMAMPVAVSMAMMGMAVVMRMASSSRGPMGVGMTKGTDTNQVYYQSSNWDGLHEEEKKNVKLLPVLKKTEFIAW